MSRQLVVALLLAHPLAQTARVAESPSRSAAHNPPKGTDPQATHPEAKTVARSCTGLALIPGFAAILLSFLSMKTRCCAFRQQRAFGPNVRKSPTR